MLCKKKLRTEKRNDSTTSPDLQIEVVFTRNPERIDEILEELKRLWKLNPEQRLGQLLENYVFFGGQRGDRTSIQLFYQEDNVTLEHLKTNSKAYEDIHKKYLKEHLG